MTSSGLPTELALQSAGGPCLREWQSAYVYKAPLSTRVPKEMSRSITWFNETDLQVNKDLKKPLIRSAIANVYEDGNRRIGRALSKEALSQGLGQPALLSLSPAIKANRVHYYQALQNAQQSNDLTAWIVWFVNMALAAQQQAEEQIAFPLRKTTLFDRFTDRLNPRQQQVVRRILEEGPSGLTGGMNAKKKGPIPCPFRHSGSLSQELICLQNANPLTHGGGRRYPVGTYWPSMPK